MTPNEYVKLLEKIQKEHQNIHIGKNKMRKIKYVYCSYDTRDNSIFSIRLREWFVLEAKVFSKGASFNEPHYKLSMYDRIITWLEEAYE